jgi:hypothetical protein
MAESVFGRLFAKNWDQSNEEAGRQSYTGSAEYVERRAWLVGSAVFHLIYAEYPKFRVLPGSWRGRTS